MEDSDDVAMPTTEEGGWFQNLPIRTQLLVSFLSLGSLALLFVFIVTIVNINLVASNAREVAKEALRTQLEANLRLYAEETASVLTRKLRRLEANVIGTTREALTLAVADDYPIKPIPSIFDLDSPNVLDLSLNERSPFPVSTKRSVYYLPQSTLNSIEADLASIPDSEHVLNRTSQLDVFFASVYANNNDVTGVYIAFANELFRFYPGGAMPAPCGGSSRSYEPTKRSWYVDAVTAAGEIVYTDPYVDAAGRGWMVTIAQAVYVDGSFVGVIGADVTLERIHEIVNGVVFEGEDDATMALVVTDSLIVISHPKVDGDLNDGCESLDLRKIIDVEYDDFRFWARMIDAGTDGKVSSFKKKKEEYLVVPASVLNGMYTFFIIVSADEAVATIPDLNAAVNSSEYVVVISFLVTCFVTLVCVSLSVYFLTLRVGNSLHRLNTFAERITANTTSGLAATDQLEEVLLESNNDEVGELEQAVDRMVRHLRAEVDRHTPKYPPNPHYMTRTPWRGAEVRPMEGHESGATSNNSGYSSDSSSVTTSDVSLNVRRIPQPRYLASLSKSKGSSFGGSGGRGSSSLELQ